MKNNSNLKSFFRSSSFLKLLILLLFAWSGFFAYWFSIHKNEHRDRLNGFVEQSIAIKNSNTNGDELVTREKISELLKPSSQILEEMGSWDKWMTLWIRIGVGVHLLLTLIIVMLLCRHFVPRSSSNSFSEPLDNRKKISERFTTFIIHMGFGIPIILSNNYLSGRWEIELHGLMYRWEITSWRPYGETYAAWVHFVANLWPNNLAIRFEKSFGAGFIGYIVLFQMLMAAWLFLPLFFKIEPEEKMPSDKPLPLERVFKFHGAKSE